jgi:hypothetical protein
MLRRSRGAADLDEDEELDSLHLAYLDGQHYAIVDAIKDVPDVPPNNPNVGDDSDDEMRTKAPYWTCPPSVLTAKAYYDLCSMRKETRCGFCRSRFVQALTNQCTVM